MEPGGERGTGRIPATQPAPSACVLVPQSLRCSHGYNVPPQTTPSPLCSAPRNPGSAQVEGVVVPIGGDFHIQARRAGIPVLGRKRLAVRTRNEVNAILAGWHTIAPDGDEPKGAVRFRQTVGAVVIRIETNEHATNPARPP